jgi:glycosyltransferase involved in cell wall biosynthesis
MVVARLAAAQAALGCQLQIVSHRFPDAEARINASLSTIPNIAGVKLEYFPSLTPAERFLAPGARRRLEPMLDQFDVIHLHGVWGPLIYAAGALAAKRGKPFVLTPHGMLDPWSMTQKRWKKRLALALGYRRMLNHAAFPHFLNADERDLAERLHFTSPTRVLPNGIFLQEFDPLPDKGAFRAARPEFAGARLVLFLSRLHYKKGLDLLADAFAILCRQFADAHLLVAGPDGGARASFESQIARLQIADRVHLLGPIYAAQKLAAMRDCDCFCLPSRQEGFSLAIIEAMACETPVVITPGCHFPDVSDRRAGIIAELDAPAIAAAIGTILRDTDAAAKMGKNGRELVVDRFIWPKIASQMVDAYRQVVLARKHSN